MKFNISILREKGVNLKKARTLKGYSVSYANEEILYIFDKDENPVLKLHYPRLLFISANGIKIEGFEGEKIGGKIEERYYYQELYLWQEN